MKKKDGEISIYDRFGNEIYYEDSYGEKWKKEPEPEPKLKEYKDLNEAIKEAREK